MDHSTPSFTPPQPSTEPQQPTPTPAPPAHPTFSPPNPPTPPSPPDHGAISVDPDPPISPTPGVTPQPVVQVLSPRGVEYVFLAIALFTGALGLGSALLSLVNGKFDFAVLAFPVAMLLVAVPVFAALFLRLKKAELEDPSLRLDASKRRTTQSIQVITFMVSFFTLIGFLSILFAKMAGQYDGSVVKLILNTLVIVVLSTGILFYYWRDEHKG